MREFTSQDGKTIVRVTDSGMQLWGQDALLNRNLPMLGEVTVLAISNHRRWMAYIDEGIVPWLYIWVMEGDEWKHRKSARLRSHGVSLQWIETGEGYPPEALRVAYSKIVFQLAPNKDGSWEQICANG